MENNNLEMMKKELSSIYADMVVNIHEEKDNAEMLQKYDELNESIVSLDPNYTKGTKLREALSEIEQICGGTK